MLLRRPSGPVALLALLAFAGCDVSTPEGPEAHDVSLAKGGNKGGGGASNDISTGATFDDAAAGLSSDGQGEYVDGTAAVEALVREGGFYWFRSGGEDRSVKLVVKDAVGNIVKNRNAPFFRLTTANQIELMQDIPVGQERFVSVGLRWEEGGNPNKSEDDWILRYGSDCRNVVEETSANFVVVRRKVNDPTGARVWVIETQAEAVGHLCTPKPKGRTPRTDLGPHTAPFVLTIVEQVP